MPPVAKRVGYASRAQIPSTGMPFSIERLGPPLSPKAMLYRLSCLASARTGHARSSAAVIGRQTHYESVTYDRQLLRWGTNGKGAVKAARE